MLVPFRLADDLADRKKDQSLHPDRELCTTTCPRNYLFALGALTCLAMIAVLSTRGNIARSLLVATMLFTGCWYVVREKLQASAIWNYHVVLTKYAAFVMILIDPDSWHIPVEVWWSSVTAYVLLLVWEVLHDATHRNDVTATRLAATEILTWSAWTLWIGLQNF